MSHSAAATNHSTSAGHSFPQPTPLNDTPEPVPQHAPQWVEVLVDSPGEQGLYSYGIAEGMSIQAGDVLSVPFGARQVGAIALRLLFQLPPKLDPHKIRNVIEVVAQGFFPANYWQLLEQVATHYQTPLMQVIRTALPPSLLSRSQCRVRLVPALQAPDLDITELQTTISATAFKLMELLRRAKTGSYTWRYLQQKVRGANGGLQELLQRGWVESFLEAPTQAQPQRRQYVTLLQAQDPDQSLTERQQQVLQQLQQAGGDLGLSQLLKLTKASDSVVKSLAKKGVVSVQLREVLRSDAGLADLAPDQPKALTTDQASALEKIRRLQGFQELLLHGVTGSGKTEVYLQAIAPILAQGKSALVLVPEIGLTPQLTDRFRQRFGDRVCVYHSGLSRGERYDTWRQMLLDQPQVVIGTRSAVFAPLPNLGLLVLDEEHDISFKQEQPMPCYHARTVARWRGQLEDCPVLLGSATPSSDSWVRARHQPQASSSLYLSLPQRIHARPHPPVTVVDLRNEFHQGNRSIFSRQLQKALHQVQQNGEQALLFIHRRGHSTFVSCRECGLVIGCPNCDVSLSYHHSHANAQPLLRCHYCNHLRGHPERCPDCQSPYIKNFGSGTQKVTQELGRLFPQLRWLRFDSDSTRHKGAHRQLLAKFAAGEADVLVGTQMLTKGIDLPQVTLVGIMAADGLLHRSSYRAGEQACQTLLQVAGRAGRGDVPGQVILQTYSPDHPVIAAVQSQRYRDFLEADLKERAEQHYPPHGRLILFRLSGREDSQVEQAAERLRTELEQIWSQSSLPALPPPESWELLGPSPAAIPRVAQRFRWQLLLKASLDASQSLLLPPLSQLRRHCPKSVSLLIDVDPLQVG